MDTSKLFKIIELVLTVLTTVVALVKRSFPVENAPENE